MDVYLRRVSVISEHDAARQLSAIYCYCLYSWIDERCVIRICLGANSEDQLELIFVLGGFWLVAMYVTSGGDSIDTSFHSNIC